MRPVSTYRFLTSLSIALLATLGTSCDSPTPAEILPGETRSRTSVAGDGTLGDAALFVGNLVPGVPAGNGIFRFDGSGRLIDHMALGGCCNTLGPDGLVYTNRMFGVHRFNSVTGEFVDVFVPSGHGGLEAPLTLLFGPDANLYVGDRITHSIRRYDARTGAPLGRPGAAAADAEFVKGHEQGMGTADPQFFAFGPDGNIYAASTATSRVLRYHGTTGEFIDEFVPALTAGLENPSGLTFGPDGHLYVGSTATDRVLRFHGVTGEYLGDFVSAGSGGLDLPVGLTFGPDGNLYVASAATPEVSSVLRYDGRTGAFIDAFIPPGGGVTGPRSLAFIEKIDVCHRPPGHADAARTIRIGFMSAFDHVAHGDFLGACS